MSAKFGEYTPGQWATLVIAICIVLVQGIWLFRDAQKRGRFPWLWGLWGLLHFPTPLIFYYIFVIRRDRKKNRNKPLD